jgi:hypothetical protein
MRNEIGGAEADVAGGTGCAAATTAQAASGTALHGAAHRRW